MVRGTDGADLPRQRNGNWGAEWPELLRVIERAGVREIKLLPTGSNYVFILELEDEVAGSGAAVYKPRKGEAPLWDYPNGTLYRRERAAYVLSQALGWSFVPPTVVRDGPHGVGMVQLHIDHQPRLNYFTVRDERHDELRRMALFDVIVNNGDRKGGHCLIDHDGRLWGIDHGLTFHHEGKLRTVIWDYVGERLAAGLLTAVERLHGMLEGGHSSVAELDDLLSKNERRALCGRVEEVLYTRSFPEPPPWRPVPWPAI